MALAFTGLGYDSNFAIYEGAPLVSGLSLTAGDLLIVTGFVYDVNGDQDPEYSLVGGVSLNTSWGTITDLNLYTGSSYYGDALTNAWIVAVNSTGSGRSVTMDGYTDGSLGPIISLTVVKVTGHNTSTPIGAKTSGTSTTNNLTTTAITTTAANSYVFASGYEPFANGGPTSSDLTTYAPGLGFLAGWKTAPTTGSYTANLDAVGTGAAGWTYVFLEVKVAGGTAHTASGTSTITATATASMSSSRVGAGSSTETATGTAAASNQRTLAATATATASATAAMSSTQVIGASGTGTASGTAAGAITAVVTISGAATGTASGTAGASSTQVFAGSATVTATGTADSSIRPIVTVDGSGSITATGATTASKQQTLAGSATASASATAGLISITPISGASTVTATATALALITTPGTLYGNATKVAGLYGSSTKPTLTTRS